MSSSPGLDDVAALAAAKRILADVLTLQEAQIAGGHRLLDDLAMDSLELIELAMELEERWNLKLDPERLGSITTVHDLATLFMHS
jgi:acyl carrier protein